MSYLWRCSDGKPLPVSPDTQLSTHTNTILIPNEIYPVGVSWPNCYSDIFELIADDHDIVHVSYFIIKPRKYPAYIAKITFKRQGLPDTISKMNPSVRHFSSLISTKAAEDSDIQQNLFYFSSFHAIGEPAKDNKKIYKKKKKKTQLQMPVPEDERVIIKMRPN